MADKIDWLNRHLVLLRYLAVADAAEKEGYKIPPQEEELFALNPGAEDAVFHLADKGNFKEACALLAYIAHRRAAIWWGYRCVLSLLEELRQNPAVDRDIADIAADFTVTVPDWAKIELPPPPDTSPLSAQVADLRAQNKEMEALVNPEILKLVRDAVEVAFQEFKKIHGIHPIDLAKKLGERINEPRVVIDPASPIFKAEAELKAQLAAVQKETVETIKAVLPSKVPAHEKKLRDNALSAVYRWVAAPDAENSQKCLDIGNECADTPAGLLCLSGFWAYGNLMPLGEQTVPTPPGLAANGLNQVFLLSALHKGGTRKVKERYEEYFRIGVEVLTGADNWETSLASGKMPHEEISFPGETPVNKPESKTAPAAPVASASPAVPAAEGIQNGNGYKRWKPEGNL
ncbi:hypothetical protein LQZ19_01895 [Treponema primitia]|uniref:DUF6931 family protein n=1 Tax=Treponema primitia TaxID=88058 RepID=UPI00398030E7